MWAAVNVGGDLFASPQVFKIALDTLLIAPGSLLPIAGIPKESNHDESICCTE
jgi:hypothetical protein